MSDEQIQLIYQELEDSLKEDAKDLWEKGKDELSPFLKNLAQVSFKIKFASGDEKEELLKTKQFILQGIKTIKVSLSKKFEEKSLDLLERILKIIVRVIFATVV